MLFFSVDSYKDTGLSDKLERQTHISLHKPHLWLFVQQIMSFSTNKAFPTILFISAGYVPCCVKSTVGSLNCINRTEWVVGYLHRKELMICFTTVVLCWSPVEANILLVCHCSLHFAHFQLQTKVFERCSKRCNKWFLTTRWWKNTSSSPFWRKSSSTLDMRPLESLLWIQWVICYYIWPTRWSRLKRNWLMFFCVCFIKDTWTPEDVMPKKLREKQK